MKRPEGFDPPARQPAPNKSAKPAREPRPAKPAREARPAKPDPARQSSPRETSAPAPPSPAPSPRVPRPSRQPAPDAGARAELRHAARERRKAERAEVRRFTRRTRNRRVALAAVAGTVVTLIGLVLTAVYSPILALRQVRVDGASRVSADEIVAAVDGQLGTPLALLDFTEIEKELGAFPLIRSYVTQTLPPDTLVIQIVERQPVGSVAAPAGGFELVDPAGIVLQQSPERIPGVPLIDLAGGTVSDPAFDAAVEVLLALPPTLLAQVDTISAHTQDDVALVLTGVGQRVKWGSADESARKATLLAALIAVTDPAQAGEFDVSAPSNGVFRPA
ncbi:FtsQ-type POTRA domain-containing protein [Schumannella luteola]